MRHSQRANEPLLNVWVKTDKEGIVKCAHCTCMAGLGEVCSHVGAILFYVSVTHRVKSCTEVSCAWSIPSSIDSIPYAKIADIDFSKPKSTILPVKRAAHCNNDCEMLTDSATIEAPEGTPHSSGPSRSGSLNPNMIPTSENEATLFFNNAIKHNPAVLSLLSPYCDSYVPSGSDDVPLNIPALSSLYKAENEELTYKELLDVGEDIVFELIKDQILTIERHTKAQYASDLWFKHRAGRITASKMKAACRTDPASPSISLIKQICYPKQCSFSTAATRWGCEHEDIAKELYITEMQKEHTEFDSFCLGLVVSEEFPFIAATPDGFRHCACHGDGVVEVKCPYCTNDLDAELATFIEEGTLPKTHQYYYQVQIQMMACHVEFADFVVCTFPNKKPSLFVTRIDIDPDFISNCIDESGTFYRAAILPELLGRWFTRSVIMPESATDGRNEEYTYCYCKEELGGEMVHCDNDVCHYGEWFHLSCLGLKKVPRSKTWHCPDCRKELKNKKTK